jgi:CheY-like chemotaxis protein
MNILVVDDEVDIEPLFQQRFRKEIRAGEVRFTFAHSGQEALLYLKGQASIEILILSDINMPGMSGIELLKQIRASPFSPPPRVMMITAYSDEYNYSQAMQYGAEEFLTKPLDFSALKDILIKGNPKGA